MMSVANYIALNFNFGKFNSEAHFSIYSIYDMNA